MAAINEMIQTGARGIYDSHTHLLYRLMISMLFVATIPMILLGIVMVGGDSTSIVHNIGLANTIFIITLVTLIVVVM